MMFVHNLKTLIKRYKKGEETLRTLLTRCILLPNRLRYHPVRILEEKWDYLIVLDACRYDIFKQINTIPGELSSRFSIGTHTAEWSQKNFNKKLDDIIYISANPQVSQRRLKARTGLANPFFHLENVWQWGWDDKLKTVHPQQVNDVVLKLRTKYHNKRMIIHYIQPHIPFIGIPNLQHKEESKDVAIAGWWQYQIRNGQFTIEQFKEAYIANLRLVLDYVGRLTSKLQGRIIITADHGESFGQMGIYEHPPMMYMRTLLEIPWLVIEKGERINPTPIHNVQQRQKPPQQNSDQPTADNSEKQIREKLKSLGYFE